MPTSIPDFPQTEDFLKFDSEIQGLSDFIVDCSTPFTITIEGAWGVGKTSIMEALKKKLREYHEKSFKIIDLNSWQYSLFSPESVTPVKIFSGILKKIGELESDINLRTKFYNNCRDAAGNLLKLGVIIGSKAAGITTENGVDIGNTLKELFFTDKSDLLKLKIEIENIIKKITNNKHKIIFFIDDLDRLVPEDAVSVLEILKNVFDLENCLFIISIDSDIIQKGLIKKYGNNRLGEKNYKNFFDKIVQLNFIVPNHKYELDYFFETYLTQINLFTTEELKSFVTNRVSNEDSSVKKLIIEISETIIGKNPRSLKKLINQISLKLIIAQNIDYNIDTKNKIAFFIMVAIEMQYPQIDRLLNSKLYWDWKIDFARNHGIQIAADVETITPEIILEAACDKYELKDDFLKLKKVLTIAKDILLAEISGSDDYGESDENEVQKIRRNYEQLKVIKSTTTINNNPISDSDSEFNIRKSNNYRRRMYSYLKEIEENWDVIFGEKKDRVLVEDLLNKFAELVERELKEDYPADYQERINRFRYGAMLAQTKIMTINEKNRLNFNVNLRSTHDLFYYPEITKEKIGYVGVWKKTLIQPFRKIPRERINDYMNFKK